VRERERRLSRVLARFDRSGNCASIFPSVETVLKRLRSAELNYPEHGAPWARHMSWSRATVFRYLAGLRASGIEKPAGLSACRGTRRRTLNPARLLSVPCESETPTRRESETRIKTLDSKKLHNDRKNHPQKSRDDIPNCSSQVNPNVKPGMRPRVPEAKPYELRIERFIQRARDQIAETYSLDRGIVSAELFDIRAKADDADTKIQSDRYFVTAFLNRLPEVQRKQNRLIDLEIDRERTAQARKHVAPVVEPKRNRDERPAPQGSPPLSMAEVLNLVRKARAEFSRRE
jgi:hypothetical protein